MSPSKWRFLAHFGAFWEGSVTDPQSREQLITISRKYVYNRRTRGQSGRGTEACDHPNRDGIDRPLIAFKDVKGIKDCRAAACAIFGNSLRSMCAGPINREDSVKPRQQLELEIPHL
jgi:hypothetical protein